MSLSIVGMEGASRQNEMKYQKLEIKHEWKERKSQAIYCAVLFVTAFFSSYM